ncbi:mechanosensitive ion channel family protein [Clostridium sp. UBA4548]|uniref:mechanosensitive ion channel family protein n=1 Tax=Clostridium sp. UBA4548 TaxID=1946361 RepID=UPI0025BC339B|nr:mechanosensitive ion channel family protein [Clostridium sp. UBA4548]
MYLASLDIFSNELVKEVMSSNAYNIWKNVAIGTGIFVLLLFLRNIFAKYIIKILDKVFSKLNFRATHKVIMAFEGSFKSFFIVLGGYIFLRSLSNALPISILLINNLLSTAIVLLIVNGLLNLTKDSSILFEKVNETYDVRIDKIFYPLISKVLKAVVLAFAVIQIADIWGFDIKAFITGLGLGGLAFALAAKDFAANLIAGVVIIFDKPFSIGDWIKCRDLEGVVEDISFRSTKIRTFEKVLITVPNSMLANDPILNFNRRDTRRVTMNLGITYNTTIEKIQMCVDRIYIMLCEHYGVNKDTAHVSFDKFNESSLDIFVQFFTNTVQFEEFMKIKQDINCNIMKILQEEDISIAFPSRSIYMEDISTNINNNISKLEN